jgi:hypothetical protein
MVKTNAAPQSTPPSLHGGSSPQTHSSPGQANFVGMAVSMGWQLAVVVLVPIIGGVQMDKVLDTTAVCTVLGFLLAIAGSTVVMWRTLQQANKLPVPKLTAAEKRAIKKQYEDDD